MANDKKTNKTIKFLTKLVSGLNVLAGFMIFSLIDSFQTAFGTIVALLVGGILVVAGSAQLIIADPEKFDKDCID